MLIKNEGCFEGLLFSPCLTIKQFVLLSRHLRQMFYISILRYITVIRKLAGYLFITL